MSSKSKKQNKKKQLSKNIIQLDNCQAEEEEKKTLNIQMPATSTTKVDFFEIKNSTTDSLINNKNIDTEDLVRSGQITDESFESCKSNETIKPFHTVLNKNDEDSTTTDEEINQFEAIKDTFDQSNSIEKEQIIELDDTDKETIVEDENEDERSSIEVLNEKSSDEDEVEHTSSPSSLSEEQYESTTNTNDESLTEELLIESSDEAKITKISSKIDNLVKEDELVKNEEHSTQKQTDDKLILHEEQDDSVTGNNHKTITIESIEKDVEKPSQEIGVEITNENEEEKNVKNEDEMDLIEEQEDKVQTENKNQKIDEIVSYHSNEEIIQEEVVNSIEQDQEVKMIIQEEIEDEIILMTKNELEEKVEEAPLINEAVELISNKSIDSTHDETNRIASIKETPKEVAKDEPITTEKKLIKQLIPEENETEKESDEEDKESQVTDVEFTDDLYEEDDELSNSVEELRDFLLSGKDNENIEIELLNEIEQFVQSLSKQPLVSNRLEEEEIKIQKEEIEPEIERVNIWNT